MPDKNLVEPRMVDLLNLTIQGLLKNTFCSLQGVIESYDADETTASIKILSRRIVDEASGQNIAYPKLVDVPVLQLTGGDGGINLPIKAGDPCLVVFADRDIDNWFATGAAEVPNTKRFHSIADGFAFIGFRPLTNKVSRPDFEAVSLYKGGTQISVKDDKAAIRNPTTDLLTKMGELISAINSSISGAQVTIPGGSSAGTYPVTNSVPVNTVFTDLLYTGDVASP